MNNLNTTEGGRLFDSAVHEAPAAMPSCDIELPMAPLPWWVRYPDLSFVAHFCAYAILLAFFAGVVIRVYRII